MTMATTVPIKVARGTVRSGSRTRPAAMVADSSPTKAHRHSAALACAACIKLMPESAGMAGNACGVIDCRTVAQISKAINGVSFKIVVNNCTRPAVPTPRRLNAVQHQIAANAINMPACAELHAGTSFCTAPAKATAIAALALQIEIQ